MEEGRWGVERGKLASSFPRSLPVSALIYSEKLSARGINISF
jgi:hypothetical protein